jgi:hypothetical protein
LFVEILFDILNEKDKKPLKMISSNWHKNMPICKQAKFLGTDIYNVGIEHTNFFLLNIQLSEKGQQLFQK